MLDFPYADTRQLVADVFAEAFMPPSRISTADYAAENRYLANEGGGYVGRWRHDMAPYLLEPMQTLDARLHSTTAIVGPGQCGKTEIPQNWFLKNVACDQADMLWYMQTDDALRSFVKKRINQMIESHPVMSNRLGLRSIDSSIEFKRFLGMVVEFLVATNSSLISKSAPRIVLDEVDAFSEALGDIMTLVNLRRQTYGDESMVLAMSHPDRAKKLSDDGWTAGIMAIYADSDRRIWWWECPECQGWSSPNPTATRVMRLDFPLEGSLDEIAAATRLICPCNGCILDESHRKALNATGRWIGAGQVIDQDGAMHGELLPRATAGFWIVGLMSPFIIGGIGGLARAYVKAAREVEKTGDDASLRTVVVKQWGIPYEPKKAHDALTGDVLAQRAEPELERGVVAHGVRFITAAADIQNNRFEVLYRGWGVGGESWIVDHMVQDADTAVSAADWDIMIDSLLNRQFPLSDGSGRVMGVRAAGYDASGAPGVTQQAYDGWLRWRRKGAIRRYGRVDGRDVWNLLTMKGVGTPAAPRLNVVYPDTERKDRRASAGGTVPQAQFGANQFKDDLGGHLAMTEAGPWAAHFPAWLLGGQEAGPYPFFEQLVAEARKPNGTWEKVAPGAKNEALDLMVMTHALAHLLGVKRMNWDSPYAWAAAWDNNSMVKRAPPAVLVAVKQDAPAVNGALPDAVAVPPRPAAGAAPVAMNKVPAIKWIDSIPVNR